MQIAILLYPGFTPLDAVGPYQALAGTPGYDCSFVAERPGMVGNDSGFSVEATMGIDELPTVDVLVVPGGLAAIHLAASGGPLIDWIREVHPTTQWTTSVCTGSLMLGAAGVLNGRRATTHWYCMDDLSAFGATAVSERVVTDGKVITSAGVSAGIDMGLVLAEQLVDTEWAQTVQLDMEYDPAPHLQSGHPRSAPPHITAQVTSLYDRALGRG